MDLITDTLRISNEYRICQNLCLHTKGTTIQFQVEITDMNLISHDYLNWTVSVKKMRHFSETSIKDKLKIEAERISFPSPIYLFNEISADQHDVTYVTGDEGILVYRFKIKPYEQR